MKTWMGIPALLMLALTACSTFTESDRALLSSTGATASEAKAESARAAAMAKEASDAARAAEQRAAAAEEASKKAAADAQAARTQADQMFKKSIRK